MFCPTCGRDNSTGLKFCASCGTNLEAISQALYETDDNFFTKIDAGFDYFLAKYAERVFKNAPSNALDRRLGNSWRVLGQSAITSFVDILLFTLVWNVIPLRLLILLTSTPFRLLYEKGRSKSAIAGGRGQHELANPARQPWLPEPAGSITEHTTIILTDPTQGHRQDADKSSRG